MNKTPKHNYDGINQQALQQFTQIKQNDGSIDLFLEANAESLFNAMANFIDSNDPNLIVDLTSQSIRKIVCALPSLSEQPNATFCILEHLKDVAAEYLQSQNDSRRLERLASIMETVRFY